MPPQAEAYTAAPFAESPAGDAVGPELLATYAAEALEHLRAAEAALLDLETRPDDPACLQTAFRAFHAIKGASGFLGLDAVQALAHRAENLLAQARDGHLRLAGPAADLALESCDALRALILALDGPPPGAAAPEERLQTRAAGLLERLAAPQALRPRADAEEPAPFVPRLGDILVAKGVVRREAVEALAHQQGARPLGQTLVRFGAASVADVARALRAQLQIADALAHGAGGPEASVRVSTGRLDRLLFLVNELLSLHGAPPGEGEAPAEPPGSAWTAPQGLRPPAARMGQLLQEMRDVCLALRLVPLRDTVQRMARLVRELGRKTGKAVRLVATGEEAEVDRTLAEALSDPLVHLVRNAVGHGLEDAAERSGAGKPPVGTVRLAARHAAGGLVVEVGDDGRGLDTARILAKAIARGLVPPGQPLSPAAVLDLLCRPGFSTAEEVTDLAGRGVGLDVVQACAERFHGRLAVDSVPGRGTTFTLHLPLTMAIADAELLRVGRESYLLPVSCVAQLFRPDRDEVSCGAGGEWVELGGERLLLVRLAERLRIEGAVADPCEGVVAVVEADGRRAGLLADEFLGHQQVIVKPLGQGLGGVPGIAGGVVLGDGRVGLVLDPAAFCPRPGEGEAPAEPALHAPGNAELPALTDALAPG